MKRYLILLGLITVFSAACDREKLPPIENIKLPPGFKIEVFAYKVPNARGMTLGDKGTLFVGSKDLGTVYAIIDDPHHPKKKKVLVIASGLNMPVGVAFKDGALYVSEVDRILRYDDIEKNLNHPPKPAVVNDTFPREDDHGWKFIAFGPDGWLYIPVGAPCNVCRSEDARFATIMRMKPDGSNLEIFAHGIRNSVGFDWHPKTKDLWFTDNGRDWMGDDLPPDELNRASHKGLDFGFPYCHGNSIVDPEFGQGHTCEEFTQSVVELAPHVAALGMRFYHGNQFPQDYQNKIFIAEHGSWNRTSPVGYRITMVNPDFEPQKSYHVFAEGWLHNNESWGRPVDVQVMPDGSLLVSDDLADAIYRISYEK
uniref:PQQ-dependent sugar dehydrogenase n=1 Tax=Candidatus Berkiella aquae TaxID=295108 RepID=UPI001F3F9C48|nr:sorbosone dehydrogenase family protein [Candidatus Berkiella aquae]